MNPATRSPELRDWLQLASLAEELRSENSLEAQSNRIISLTQSLLDGEVDVWLQEKIFRLPDWEEESVFPPLPLLDGMKRAFKAGKLVAHIGKTKNPAASQTFAALPLENQGITFGLLQITRPQNSEFSDDELHLLQGLAQIISMSLLASHRAEVEEFRLRQINLVRQVSAQIANVINLDELALLHAG